VIVEDHDTLLKESVTLEGDIKIQPTELVESTVFSEVNAYYIVSDQAYENLPDPVRDSRFFSWLAKGKAEEKLIDVGEVLEEKFEQNEWFVVDYTIIWLIKHMDLFYLLVCLSGLFSSFHLGAFYISDYILMWMKISRNSNQLRKWA